MAWCCKEIKEVTNVIFFGKLIDYYAIFLKPQVWVPVLVFVLFYILHFWLTIVAPDVLYGGPGDHTAGLIWLYDNSPTTPWWKFTNASGYPWGDDLWSPLFVTGQIGYVLFWIFSKLFGGAVAGYNTYIALGLLLSYAIGYLFIYKRHIKQPFIASLLALLFVASPAMLSVIAVGHPSYVFAPFYVILTIWLILKLIETHSWKLSLLAGLVIGSTVIFDPYFVLMVPALAATFLVCLALFNWNKIRQIPIKSLLIKMSLVVGGALIVVIPAFIYVISQADSIAAISSSSRSPIREDAYAYSARPEDFVLPAVDNPLTLPVLNKFKLNTFHGSDPTFTLYVGAFVLIAMIVSVVWWLRRRDYNDHDARKLALSFLVVALVAFALSLPPTLNMFGINVPMPSWAITHFASIWRVFARFFFIVQPMIILFIVVTFAAYLKYRKPSVRSKRLIYIIAAILIVVTLIDYLPRNPFEASNFWTYAKDLPVSYQELKKDKYSVIAEYPMREQPYYKGSLYLTGQHVHNKKMVNAYSPTNAQVLVRLNIIDLNNPQTIPVLRYMGVDTLVVWDGDYQVWKPTKVGDVREVSNESYKSKFGNNNITLYKIQSGVEQRYLGFVEKGYRPDESALYDIGVPLQDGVRLGVMDLCPMMPKGLTCDAVMGEMRLRGTIYSKSDDNIAIKIKDEAGTVREEFLLDKSNRDIDIKTGIEAYRVEFDAKYNDKVFYKDVHVVEN